jgi:hypothetical protein
MIAILSLTLAFGAAADPQDSPKPLKPTNLEKLNTAADEDDPHIASNGLALYYASNAKKKFDIMVSRRASTRQLWPAGKIVGDWLQTDVDDRGVFLTSEGRYPQFIYFATKKDKDTNNFDIYVAVKQDARAAFSEPTPLNTISTADDEMHPWLSPNGRDLYFSRKTKEGWRVYVASRKMATGAAGFGKPKLLEELPPDFHHATLSPDGRTMYLQGPLAKDRWGLYRSVHSVKGWSKPEPLADLNDADGPTGDRSPCLSRDGLLLYFSSDRPGGKGGLDLYVIQVESLKKK